MLGWMQYNDSKGRNAMKKIECGDIVVLKSEKNRDIEAIHGRTNIVFRKGAIGKVIREEKSIISDKIDYFIIEFNLLCGVAIQIRVAPDYIKKASSQQIDYYKTYNRY